MIKILNKSDAYKADKQTIDQQGIESWELMERAGKKAADTIIDLVGYSQKKVSVFCGIGNNGGDGLVIARILANKDFSVRVFVTALSDKRSDDFKLNAERLKDKNKTKTENVEFVQIHGREDFPDFREDETLVDAVFGIGLNRPAEGWLADLFDQINAHNGAKIAIDIPSGLYLDAIPKKNDSVIAADFTIIVQFPKLVFFLPQTGAFVGRLHIIDIGMDPDFLNQVNPQAELVEMRDIQKILKPRRAFSHKGTYGHALIAGGSYGKMGSVVLSAKAALKSGAGKVTALIPSCGYEVLQTSVPEVMTLSSGINELEKCDISLKLQSLGFGIGAGTGKKAGEALENILNQHNFPAVIDADGINLLAQHPHLFDKVPENSILTPHPGELKGLIGEWEDDFDKIQKARDFADLHKIILVVKGFNTLVFLRDRLKVNANGNPGMATAGSGDVLTGILSGLLAQNYTPAQAAVSGVFLHAKAGDIAVRETGEEALIASDILTHIGKAFKAVKRHSPKLNRF